MNKIIETLLGIAVITFTNIYIWSKLLNKKINFKSIKVYIVFILMMIVTLINYFYINQYIKIATITIVMIFFIKILFNEKFNISILSSITSQMIYMISEFIFAAIIYLIFQFNSNEMIDTQSATITTNILVATFSICLVNLPFIQKLYNFFVRITNKIKNNQLIIFVFIVILIANILSMILYYKIEFIYLLIFNTFLTLFCFSIVLYSLKTKNNYIKVYDKYNTTLNSLKEYEDILDRYRVSNHENKNVLLTIRNMIPKTNKKTISYIDTIINNKIKDNDKVMLDAAKIPSGGLRGLIYSKILYMKQLKIEYELEISNEIKTVDLINNIDDSTMLDICKIIGVYIDNSIQAVQHLENKYINIEMYLEESTLIIAISNNYNGIIEIEKLEELGYTTKEKGHGYGLTLSKEIIDNNNKLSNEKKVAKEIFTQILKIKM